MLVFVYGTLKSGQPNHNLINEETRGTCVSVGTAVTREKYPLVVASRYNVPYLLYKPGTGQVSGEANYTVQKIERTNSFSIHYFFLVYFIKLSHGQNRYEPLHEISNNVVCATSKDSDQLAHTRSLIRALIFYE